MWKKKLTALILALSLLLCTFRVHAADSVLIDPGQMLMAGIDDSEFDPFSISPDYSTDTQFIPLIASGEVIAWLLAAFGLMGASALYLDTDKFNSWSNGLVSAFMAYCTGREVVLAAEASLWLANATKGVIDKSSAVYDEFKSWASSLYKSDEAISELPAAGYEFSVTDIVSTSYAKTGDYAYKLIPGDRVNYFIWYNSDKGYFYLSLWGFSKTSSVLSKASSSSDFSVKALSSLTTVTKEYPNGTKAVAYIYASPYLWKHTSFTTKDEMAQYLESYYSHIPHAYGSSASDALSSWLSSHSSLISYTIGENTLYPSSAAIKDRWKSSGSLKDIDIQVGNNSAAESIDIPWQDLLGKYESISAQLGQVSEGLISLDDALASVGAQIVAGQDVIAGDDATTDADTDTDGSGGNNTDNPPSSKPAAYALDLTKYFPFCIPFDLYEFASILAAEPQTPCFDLPLNLGSLLGTYTIRVDLSPFNGIAALIRLSVLFLFCTSLARATRDIIRA